MSMSHIVTRSMSRKNMEHGGGKQTQSSHAENQENSNTQGKVADAVEQVSKVSSNESKGQPELSEDGEKTDVNDSFSTESAAGNVAGESNEMGDDPGVSIAEEDDKNLKKTSSDTGGESSTNDEREKISSSNSQAEGPPDHDSPTGYASTSVPSHSANDDSDAFSEDLLSGKGEQRQQKPNEQTSERKPGLRFRLRQTETPQPKEEESQRGKPPWQAEGAISSDDDEDEDVHGKGPSLQGKPNKDIRQGNVYFILILVVFSLAGVLVVRLWTDTGIKNHEPKVGDSTVIEASSTMEILHRNMKFMEETFKGQIPRFWSVIETSLESIVARQPLHPSVIMIVSGPERSDTAKAIAQQVANSLQLSDNKAVEIHNEDIESPDPAEVKFRLDELMGEALGGRSKAAVLYNIENLETSALSILFKYCDNVNAPYKDAVIVFTACMKDGFDPESNLKDREEALEDFLIEHWKTMSSGKLGDHFLSPLMSRIGNSVAIVT